MRKDRRIEAHGVFDKHYHLYAHLRDIVGIKLVFKKLDDGKKKIHVAEPAEHIVDFRHVFHSQTSRHFLAERCQYHYRRSRELCFYQS